MENGSRGFFLIFWMNLGDYKGSKVTEAIFEKNSTRYDLQFERNLFLRTICNLEIFDFEIVKILPKLRFLVIFSTFHH